MHTIPQTEDSLLSSHSECPRFDQLQDELEKSPEFEKIYADNKELFKFISENSGSKVTNVVELDYIYDTLFIEHNNNRKVIHLRYFKNSKLLLIIFKERLVRLIKD